MKTIQLTDDQAAEVKPWLDDCQKNGLASPHVLAGQVRRGSWDEGTEKVVLFLAAIHPETAKKIRRLLEREKERETSTKRKEQQ